MKRIDVNDIVNTIVKTNKYGNIKILDFVEKNDKDYIYKVLFIDTNNEQLVTRSSIKRNSCVDEKLKLENKKNNKKNKINNRLKLNIFKNQEYININKNNFKTLALDQSTTGCAYSIFIDKQMIKYGKINTSNIDNSILKIIKIRDEVNNLIKQESIDLIVLEDIYMGYNVETFKTLAILLGSLEILAYENNIKCLLQTAYNWKKGVNLNLSKHDKNSKRREYQKNASINLANKLFYLELTDDDIADSLLIGYHTVNNCLIYSKIDFINNNWE